MDKQQELAIQYGRRLRRKPRIAIGERAACAICNQDIEWTGSKGKWRDRGGNRGCVPYQANGEIVTPPKTAKHKPI